MSHAAQYESDSGKSCADLIYKLDSIFCSRPPASEEDRSNPIIRALLEPCNSNWSIPKARALLFCATFYGLYIFVEQAIAPLTPQVTVTTMNYLLRTLVLGCYHHEEWDPLEQTLPRMGDVVTFICGKGANPNIVVETTPPVTTVDNHNPATPTWTIWELYLQQEGSKIEHVKHLTVEFFDMNDKWCVMDSLVESGADLECKLPVGCPSLQQAIKRRLEKNYRPAWDPSREAKRRREKIGQVRTALLKRGYIWTEAGRKK
ncbi:hypothetical protein MBLNU13_g06946t1 [Cladosporium sp. NU13]